MNRRALAAAVVGCALIAPTPAQAGTPFTIGEGNDPHLLTQSDNGLAHVVWQNDTGGVTYCRVPRGATSCASPQNLVKPPPDFTLSAPFLVRESATVLHVVMPASVPGEVWRRTSTDNGASWPTPWVKLYDGVSTMGGSSDAPILWPTPADLVVATNGGNVFSATMSGSESAGGPYSDFDEESLDTAAIGIPGGLLLVSHNASTAQMRVLTDVENPSTEAQWSAPIPLPGTFRDTRLASGPSGIYAVGNGPGGGGGSAEIRRYDGTTFPVGQTLDTETSYFNDVTVSPTGAVGVIFRRNDSSAPGNRLIMALSSNGTTPYGTATIAREESVMSGMDLSLAADNAGWAVYEGQGGGATQRIRLVDTSVVPEPTPPPTPPVTPTPIPPVTFPTDPVSKPLTPGKSVSARVNGATLALGVPRGCIPSGRPFIATLSWKKQRRKGNLFVKVRRTDFYIGTTRQKIDKKAPFRQTLRIPNPKKGQTYRLRAQAFIKMKRGKSPKKSIVTTLKVCS